MGIQFAGGTAPKAQSEPENAVLKLPDYDIQEDRKQVETALLASPEIEELTAMIDVNDLNTIVTFGAKSAEEISRVSDAVLRSINVSQLDESSEMLVTLSRIMEKFDI
ncbi:MAG: toxic anion resistance protein, partial [Clostridia bacterium]|nr:toxic anion resistance protein [Clostridia bacterium]